MMTKNFPTALIAFALIVVVSLGCNAMEDSEAAKKEVERFHERFNAGRFTEIYDASHEDFKEVTSKEELEEFLTSVKRKLGTVEDSRQTNWGVSSTPFGTQVTLSYEVTFSDSTGVEHFVFKVSGKKAELLSFNINASDLVTR